MNTHPARTMFRATLLLAAMSLGACATGGGGMFRAPPEWVAELRSNAPLCTTAADEAKGLALASGVHPSRMHWLYGKKPFNDVGHVSLVIDGWIVVDNGGLGRDLWGEPICPGNVCTLEEARRGYEDSFVESAQLALRHEVAIGDWQGLVAAAR